MHFLNFDKINTYKMEKLIYTWEQQIADTNLICEKIEADNFNPDVIVGISRGGLIPGVMISHKLNIPFKPCLLYTSPSPRDRQKSRMPSSA